MREFDLVVIGSGPGGYRAAVLGVMRGLSVAIIEKAQWGGCCLNRGCVPKKAWHHTARLIASGQGFAGRGVRGVLTADLDQAWRHQRQVSAAVRDSYRDYLKRLGIVAIEGEAAFVDAHRVAVDGKKEVRGRHFVVATGASPFVPAPFVLTPGRVLTTDELFDVPPPPGKRMALIGSGAIGTEFAFILAMFGLEVVWIAQSAPLANSRFSSPALKLLHDALREQGVVPRTGCRALGAEITDESVRLMLDDGSTAEVDWVLLGTGRRPHTAALNLAAAGVTVTDRGFIAVNDFLQSSMPHIYAIGDVSNSHMTANHALADAAAAVANIVAPGSRRRDNLAVPELVYSAVELGRIGLSEKQAEDEGLEPATGFAAFETDPCALGQDDTAGFVRLIADMDDGRLLGAEVAGAEAGELIHLIALHYGREDALRQFSQSCYNHPARAEGLQNAAETLAARWGLVKQVFGG
jgi:dihydrolipoamide dehydrogenase